MKLIPESLSLESIRVAICDVCEVANAKTIGYTFHCAKFDDDDEKKTSKLLFGFITRTTNTGQEHDERQQHQSITTSFSIQYSTWEGRVLFVEKLGLDDNDDKSSNNSNNNNSELLLVLRQILSSIAINCYCSRLTWTHYGKDIDFAGYPKSDSHEEVTTLFWSSDAMQQYVGQDNPVLSLVRYNENSIDYKKDIIACLNQSQNNSPKNVRLRLSTVDDLQTIQRLVQGLADFAQEPDAVTITTEHYEVDGYDTNWPLFYCLLLDSTNESNDEVYTFGIAIFYFGYTIDGEKYLYLEDFFIEESYRGNGCGKYVMEILASVSLGLQCSRMVWLSLIWNHPALQFYKGIGATIEDGRLTSRIANDNLKSFAIFAQ